MSIDSVSVTEDSSGTPIAVVDEVGDTLTEFYTMTLVRSLTIGERISVGIDYSGIIPNGGSGMYWVSYPDPDQGITRYKNPVS